MFKKIILIPCLCYTMTLSKEINSSQIDPSKRGVALGTFLTYERAKKVVNKLPNFDIYIKETTTTKKPYYVPFALNLDKKNLKNRLKQIKKKIPSAYITSNSRVKQLSEEKLIASNTKTKKKENITLLNSGDKVVDAIIQKETQRSKKIIDKKNLVVDTTLKAITVDKFPTLSDAVKNASKLKEYDILIKAPIITGSDFTLYIINIDQEEFSFVNEEISSIFPSIEEASQTRINFIHNRYINGDKFIKATIKPVETKDSSVYVLNLINKLQNDKKSNFLAKYNQAKSLYDRGEYAKSIDAFDALSMEKSDNVSINFYLARSYYKLGKFEQASAAFERVLIIDENQQRARLELALTYAQLNLNEEAIREFKIVLKDKTVPKNVVLNIEKKIEQIENKKRKHFFFGNLTLGITSDTNPNTVTDNKNFDTPTQQGLKITDEIYSDTIYTTGVNGNYVYKISDNYSISNKFGYTHQFYKKDDLRLEDSTKKGISKEKKKELEIFSYSLHLSKFNPDSMISGGFDYSKINFGKKDYSRTVGATISYQSKIFRNTKNLAVLKVYRKNYTEKDTDGKLISENLDSDNIQVLLGNSIPTDKFGIFTLLYSHLREDRIQPEKYGKSSKTSDKETNTFIFTNDYPFSDTISLNSSIFYSRITNSDHDSTFRVRKKEGLLSIGVGAAYKVNKNLTVSTEVKHTDNDSNIKIYSYDKQTYGLNLKYFF